MRVGMAKVLLGNFDVLLLDEPTNHLDIESILWLEQFLQQTEAAVLMTCHDRDFMNRVVDRIIDIDERRVHLLHGRLRLHGARAEEPRAQQEAAFARQQAMIAKMQRFIDRFGTHVAKAAQAQSRQKKIDKIERIEPPKKREIVPFACKKPPRSGDDIVTIQGVTRPTARRRSTRPRLRDQARRTLVRDGPERLRQDDAAEDGRRPPASPTAAS
jgi:ATPase subunit of ABC transporter with duplicated ATPase domains